MPPKRRIGKYELGKTLGQGNFSKVRHAVDLESNEAWALKIIEKEKVRHDRLEAQLSREIAMMKKVSHENIVRLREVMQTSNYYILVVELVPGGDLLELVQRKQRLTEAEARKYFHELMLGLACCHQNGIAHRDIKLENLLLDQNGVLKIADFGLSNFQPAGSTECLMETVCGTPNYVAPEVILGKPYNGFIADIWSCGVVLFALLSGRLPFDEESQPVLFRKIERGDFNMSHKIPETAQDLIRKILVTDPAARYTVEDILGHPWFTEGFDVRRRDSLASCKVPLPTDEECAAAIRGEVDSGVANDPGSPEAPAKAESQTSKAPAEAASPKTAVPSTPAASP